MVAVSVCVCDHYHRENTSFVTYLFYCRWTDGSKSEIIVTDSQFERDGYSECLQAVLLKS